MPIFFSLLKSAGRFQYSKLVNIIGMVNFSFGGVRYLGSRFNNELECKLKRTRGWQKVALNSKQLGIRHRPLKTSKITHVYGVHAYVYRTLPAQWLGHDYVIQVWTASASV